MKDEDPELPQVVRDIKRETEELIRMSDKAFLQLCKIAWADDIEHPFAATPEQPVQRDRAWRRCLRTLRRFLARRLRRA